MKKRTKVILIIAIILSVAITLAGIMGVALHRLLWHSNDNFQVHDDKNGYVLELYYDYYNGVKMAGAVVTRDGETVFKSEEMYRIWDLHSVYFDDDMNIIVDSSDVGTKTYSFCDGTWQYTDSTARNTNSKGNGYLFYITKDNEAIITDYIGTEEKVVIPEKIEGAKVTVLCKLAFESCTFIQSITLPKYLTMIDSRCFLNCSGLKEISIPESVSSIVWDAFDGCDNLKRITVSQNNEHYYDTDGVLFHKKTGNLVVIPPASNAENLKWAYSYYENGEVLIEDLVDTKITNVIIPAEIEGRPVTGIEGGRTLFKGNFIETIEIPESIKSIGRYCFYRCSVKEFIVAPDSEFFTTIDGVLYNKDVTELVAYPPGKADKSFQMPSTVKKIDQICGFPLFDEITVQQDVEIPDGEILNYYQGHQIIFHIKRGSAMEDYLLNNMDPEAYTIEYIN